MRAVTFVVTPTDRSHPAHQTFAGDSDLVRERIYHLNLLEDGTLVLLGRLRGDLDRARRLIAERDDVLDFSISGEGESGLAYVHARVPPAIRPFLELPRRHEVFFDFPIEGTRDGGLRVVMIGETNEVLQRALSAVPAGVDLTVERIGPYPESPGSVARLLTDRQREVLDVAMELGYYEVPRRTTHREVADRLGVSVATVSEHLQKIEARVFGTLVE